MKLTKYFYRLTYVFDIWYIQILYLTSLNKESWSKPYNSPNLRYTFRCEERLKAKKNEKRSKVKEVWLEQNQK